MSDSRRRHWVGASDCALTPPEEPCVKVSLHTARASPRTFRLSDVPRSDTLGALSCILVVSDSLAILGCGRFTAFPTVAVWDAPSNWRCSSLAFPVGRRFHILSCPSRPDRRRHIWRITRQPWLLRSSPCWLRNPALRLGRPRTAWPGVSAFPCSAFDTGWI